MLVTTTLISALSIYATKADGPMRGAGLAYWSCDDAEAMEAGWMYNGEADHPCPDSNIPWVPMIWGGDDIWKASSLKGGDYDAVLGMIIFYTYMYIHL